MHEFDKCIIFTKEGMKVAEGFVHEFAANRMKIYTQGDTGRAVLPGADVFLYVYNNVKGECKYTGTVDKSTFNNVEIDAVRLISSVQKRDNTRVNKQMKYRITAAFSGTEKVRLEAPVDITVLNISAKGLYFNCDRKFETGFRFPLILRETIRPIHLTVEIIRREEYPRSFNYGCVFVDISEKDMDDIFRFVLKEQIAQRRRNMFI